MLTSKEYRKLMGYTNKGEFVQHLNSKDLVEPNWSLIEKRDARIIKVFQSLRPLLMVQSSLDIQDAVLYARQQIKDNDILMQLNNHGRAIEDVYYKWMQGYIAELLFTPMIESLLGVKDIVRNGGDDLRKPESFKRKADADLKSESGKFLIDVQAGFSNNKGYDIKQHKVNEAINKTGWTSFLFFADIVNGQYHLQNLNELEEATFVPNPRWEGQMCYGVDSSEMKTFIGEYDGKTV